MVIMETVTLPIFECEPGMKIGQTIYNDFGAVIINKGTILDKGALRRLESMDLFELKVFLQNEEEIQENYLDDVQRKYRENMDLIKNQASKIRLGSSLDMSVVRKITMEIYSGAYSIHDMIGPLARMGRLGTYNYTHSINVAILAMYIGNWMNCSDKTIKHLIQAGLLHDVGKCRVPEEILDKPSELTDKEFNDVKQHPVHGYRILQSISTIHKDVLHGVLTHHEREDGSGYPAGLTSERINLIAKILAVADIFDAMTSDRIYRKSQCSFEVFELMQNGSFGKLHPVILNKFIGNMSGYYIGAQVTLNNNEQGEVVFINTQAYARPIVKVGDRYVDLSMERNLKINKVIKNGVNEISE